MLVWSIVVWRAISPPVAIPPPPLGVQDMVLCRGGRIQALQGGEPVLVPTFLIDRFEVTEAEFASYARAVPEAPRPAGWEELPRSDRLHRDLPVTRLSYHAAEAFARWKRKRIPSTLEWEMAARGVLSRRYPWGDAPVSLWANTLELGVSGPTPVGLFESGKSPSGVYDMVGNVAEWTSTRGGVIVQDRHFVRGGSYAVPMKDSMVTHDWNGRERVPRHSALRGPSEWARDLGFRCALDLSVLRLRLEIARLIPRLGSRDPLGWFLHVRPAREKLLALDPNEVASALRAALEEVREPRIRDRLEGILATISERSP